MDYIKIRFGSDEFDKKCSEHDRSLGEMFQAVNPIFCLSERVWKPQMDIFETDEEVVIQAAVAGVAKDSLMVEISDKAVKINGYRNPHPPSGTATYRLVEIQHGNFERILFLPSAINPDRVTATYKNGFLQVNLAKLSLNKSCKIAIKEE